MSVLVSRLDDDPAMALLADPNAPLHMMTPLTSYPGRGAPMVGFQPRNVRPAVPCFANEVLADKIRLFSSTMSMDRRSFPDGAR